MIRFRKPKVTAPSPEASASDAELVQAARRGDKRAFVEIVARHQAMVCGVALGILGDFAASEDAGQEAFLTAWRKIHELRDPERLRAWLAQIARNSALGHLRRRRGHDSLDDDLDLPDESPSPDQAVASEEEAALVRESLAKLPETYRLPLVLFYREGQSVQAVAQTLEISEDAVKQRLVRGRELLRQRMSSMVETVLDRTRPTAVFTMAIAVAIGALTAPAAIAAGVFSAAAASTAGTASTTSFLTAMSTSKTFLVTTAAVAVVCVPIGYHIQTGTALPQHTNTAAQTKVELAAKTSGPNFENSALFREWRELHDKHGTNAAAMPLIYREIADMKDPVRRRAFRAALFAEWILVDPAGGFAFLAQKSSERSQRRQFFEEWLAHDPRAAVESLLTFSPGWENIARETLPDIARRVPSRVVEIVSRLPAATSHWDTKVRDAFSVLAENDVTAARKAAEALSGPNREQALAGVAHAWARGDLDAAVKWAKALPDGVDRNNIIRGALIGRAGVDPVGALEMVNLVPPGGKEGYFADTTGARVLSEAAKANYEATVAWLTANPGRLGREDLLGLAKAVTDRLNADPAAFLSRHGDDRSLAAILPAIESALLNEASGQKAAVWDWLRTQPENDVTKELRREVLNSSAWQDPDLALRLVSEVPRTPEGDAQIQTLAQSLINSGNRLHRFEKLWEHAPDRLRQPLLDAAFNSLNPDSMRDPQLWISRLSLLPENARARGTESIVRAWAHNAPEEAINWVNTLPPGDTRNNSVAAIASTWAGKDAHGAAEWVAALPPGGERDRSAGALVFTLADQFPQEAWEWALSIGDPSERARAAARAAQSIARHDLAAARQWIETGPFTPEVKVRLQADLERRSRAATHLH